MVDRDRSIALNYTVYSINVLDDTIIVLDDAAYLGEQFMLCTIYDSYDIRYTRMSSRIY